MKILLNLFLLILAFQVSSGQEKPKAKIIDEFGKIHCDDFLARMDNLFNDANAEPSSSAYVLIHSNPNNIDNNKNIEMFRGWIFGHVEARNFDNERISVVKTETDNSFKMQFWIVPKGAELPLKFKEVKPPFSKITKATLYHKDSWENSICGSDRFKRYAESLKNDVQLQGNIVIYDSTKKSILETQDYLTKSLIERYKVTRNRFKFFHRKSREIYDVEYWLVPKKNRN